MAPPSNYSQAAPRGPRRREKPAPTVGSAPPAPDATQASDRRAQAAAQPKPHTPVDSRGKASTATSSLLKPVPVADEGDAPQKRRRPLRQGSDYGTRSYYLRRLSALETERSTWLPHWWELAEYMAPRRQRRFWADRNRGIKRNEKIINSTGLISFRRLAAGMHSGLTSPARPWYQLTTPDPGLAEVPRVREWLHRTQAKMRQIHAQTNLYNILPTIYGDLGVFGTAVMWAEPQPRKVLRFYSMPVGSYSLGIGADQQVDSVYRRVSMSVSAVVDTFGYEACSTAVQDLYDHGVLDQWILTCHATEPNRAHNPADFRSKPVASVWFEPETGEGENLLRRSGFNQFPFCCPRWTVNGEDVYGGSPGMDALGDVRALQQLERRKMTTGDKLVNPPLVGPAALRNQRISLLPGDVSYLDAATPMNDRFVPVHEVHPAAMSEERAAIADHERRVREVSFADLWMLISEDERRQPATAEEIRVKQDEKMLQLGPVLEQVHGELLEPVIDITFNEMFRRGMIDPLPPELIRAAENGEDELKVEFISVLAQAMKLMSVATLDRQLQSVARVAQLRPEAVDLLNPDRLVRDYQVALGTDPETLLSDEQVQQIRQERAQAQQAQAQAQQQLTEAQAASHASTAAQKLSGTSLADPNGPSALTALLGTLGPAAVVGAGQPNGGIGQ